MTVSGGSAAADFGSPNRDKVRSFFLGFVMSRLLRTLFVFTALTLTDMLTMPWLVLFLSLVVFFRSICVWTPSEVHVPYASSTAGFPSGVRVTPSISNSQLGVPITSTTTEFISCKSHYFCYHLNTPNSFKRNLSPLPRINSAISVYQILWQNLICGRWNR